MHIIQEPSPSHQTSSAAGNNFSEHKICMTRFPNQMLYRVVPTKLSCNASRFCD